MACQSVCNQVKVGMIYKWSKICEALSLYLFTLQLYTTVKRCRDGALHIYIHLYYHPYLVWILFGIPSLHLLICFHFLVHYRNESSHTCSCLASLVHNYSFKSSASMVEGLDYLSWLLLTFTNSRQYTSPSAVYPYCSDPNLDCNLGSTHIQR